MNSYCLSCILTPELKEIALAQWFSIGMTGCQESETAQGAGMQCFFKDFASRDAAKAGLLGVDPDLQIAVSEVPDQDWNAQWKASMKPALIAPGTQPRMAEAVASPIHIESRCGSSLKWVCNSELAPLITAVS